MKNIKKKIAVAGAGAVIFLAGGAGQAAINYLGMVDDIETNFYTVLGIAKDQKGKIADLEGQLDQAKQDKVKLGDSVSTLTEAKDNLTKAVTTLQAELTEVEHESEGKDAEKQKELDAKQAEVGAKQSEVDTIRQQLDSANQALNASKDENKQLQDKVGQLKVKTDKEVADLQGGN